MDKQELLKQYPDLVRDIALSFRNFKLNCTDEVLWDNFLTLKMLPEFKKDWTILSFKCNDRLFILEEGGLYRSKENSVTAFNIDALDTIHSVRRESDGEIFTVGDKYKNASGVFTISKFELCNNNIILVYAEEYGACRLNVISKVKQPLFITEDGVDIYEDDKYFWVNNEDFVARTTRANKRHPEQDKLRPGFYHNFSTEEKAEEYILMNKPCLSINDILNSFGFGTNKTVFIESCKRLIIKKLELNA